MKKLLYLLIVLSVFSSIATAKINFYAGTGITIPVEPNGFRWFWNPGLCGSAGAGIHLYGQIELLGMIDYSYYPIKSVVDGFSYEEGEVEFLITTLEFKFRFPECKGGKIQPYLRSGLGYSFLFFEDQFVTNGTEVVYKFKNQSRFAMVMSLGTEFRIFHGRILWIEAKANSLSALGLDFNKSGVMIDKGDDILAVQFLLGIKL